MDKVLLNESVINELIKKNHLTKAYLSISCSYSQSYLSHSLANKRKVEYEFAKGISEILKVNVDSLIEKEEEPEEGQIEFMTPDLLRTCKDIDTVFAFLNASNEAIQNIMKGLVKHE